VPRPPAAHFAVIGAGAAGLMAARELARAGKRVTILEARTRCGGRIDPLPAETFGYPAEGGAEFVHGAAPVTRALMREAGLSLSPRAGTRRRLRAGVLSAADPPVPGAERFYRALQQVRDDLPIAEFLATHFGESRYDALRRSILRTVEGYDAADPSRASTLALREEWLARDDGEHGRIAQGYGALIAHLAAGCRDRGAAILFDAAVTAIDSLGGGLALRCAGGATFAADAAVIAVPLPCLAELRLPPSAQARAAAASDIGFGNVVKFLFGFATRWWADQGGGELADLSFLLSDAPVPTWWTQYPAAYPVLTGWLAGPKAERVAGLSEAELVALGVASLAEIFALPAERIADGLRIARAINWGNDRFARGAYSYATPQTRAAQARLRQAADDAIFFTGEALYAGPDMGTVEAALASGLETAQTILAAQ
jgi:monoamine oxidase